MEIFGFMCGFGLMFGCEILIDFLSESAHLSFAVGDVLQKG